MNQFEEFVPREQLKSKSRHKHKHRHRNRRRSASECYSEKENILLEDLKASCFEEKCDKRLDKHPDDVHVETASEESEYSERRRMKYEGGNEDDRKIAWINDQNRHDHEKNFPESFPEGITNDIVEFLERKVYILDKQSSSPNIKLPYANRPDTAQRQISKRTTDAIRGAVGFRDGVHTFEIDFNDKPWGSHCAIGVCSSSVQLYDQGYSHMLGNSPEAWVWDIPSLALYHNGENMGIYPGPSGLEMPHKFRMIIDREQRQLAFNIGLGNNVVFKDLPDSSVVLFPVVSMVYGFAEVTLKVVSSDLFKKYVWLPQAASRSGKQKNGLHSDDKLATMKIDKEQDHEKGDSGEKLKLDNAKSEDTRSNNEDADSDSTSRQSQNKADDVENVMTVNQKSDDTNKEGKTNENWLGSSDDHKYEDDRANAEEDDDDEEETDFDQESLRVESLEEDDQFMFNIIHGWDNTCKGSLIQPYPNAPHICVPMPNLVSRIQGVRSRRGFSGKGIHTWLVRELIVYTSSVAPEHMAYYRNNVIIGVATNEQRKYNFGYNIGNIGSEIWGFQYPDMMVHHGNRVYRPERGPNNPHQICLDKYDFELTDGLEMVLNTVTHRLAFVHKGTILTELRHVKGGKLYPFVMYVKDAYYPLELNYVEGPKDYFNEVLEELGTHDKQEIHHVRMIMKRSSSMREINDNVLLKDKYIWGCHSPEMVIPNKHTVSRAGIAVATFPLGGSRHKVKFHVEGSTRGFCIGFVHHGYPLQPVIQDSLPYLGNDLLSWCWDIDNKCLLHACKTMSRYPVDEAFNQDEVTAYTLTLDFSPLGNNTASFTAHLNKKDQQDQELGVAFISLPSKVLPTVVMKGNAQRLRMEYISGPWKGPDYSSIQVNDDMQVKSEVCVIL